VIKKIKSGLRFLAGQIVVVLLAPPVQAQVVETVGVRPAAMGGAFVAVADDATAAYWNPAGLATGATFSLVIDRQRFEIEGDPPEQSAAERTGFFLGLGSLPGALAYYRTRESAVLARQAPAGSPTARLTTVTLHQTTFTAVQSLTSAIVVGSAVKFVRGVVARVDQPGADARELVDEAGKLVGRATNRLDLDLGLMANFGIARAGLLVRNVREPGLNTPEGDEVELQRQVRLGFAFLPDRATILAIDLDLTRTELPTGAWRAVAVGGERWFGRRQVAVRAGVRASTTGDTRVAFSGGIGVKTYGALVVDAQVTGGASHGDLGWGLGARVAF
jgi:hypothetical protein